MAATSVLSTDAEMIAMQGESVSASVTDAMNTAWGIQAENFLCALTNYDLVTNVATLTANFAEMLSEYVARYVGICGIAYDMSGYTSRIEAEDIVNIHIYRLEKIEQQLLQGAVLKELGVE